MVRENEYGRVVRRVRAPPPFPAVVRPRTSNWPKHVATEDPRSDVREPPGGEVVVDSHGASVTPMYLLKGLGGAEPLVQRHAPDAQRIIEVLIGTSAVAVDRDRK